MTDTDINKIKELRMQGVGYKAISSILGISRDIIRNYCKKNGLDGEASVVFINVKEQMQRGEACLYCGKGVKQPEHGRSRKFCSDLCRRTWWKEHPDAALKRDTAMYSVTCAFCGEEFQSYGASASHARTLVLQENNGDWSEKEVGFISTLLTSLKTKKKVISPHTFLLRTLRTCYQLIGDLTLPLFYLKWTKQGMTQDGRCLILKTSEFRKTGSVCSLSQILEAEVDEKYYLSSKKTEQLLSRL